MNTTISDLESMTTFPGSTTINTSSGNDINELRNKIQSLDIITNHLLSKVSELENKVDNLTSRISELENPNRCKLDPEIGAVICDL